MSWLFDRLCEIAVADQVHVMLCADVDEASLRDDSPDLAEVMARAAVVPQLTMMLLPNTAQLPVAAHRVLRTVDLEELDRGCVVEAIAVAIRQQRNLPSTGVRLRGPELSLVEPPTPRQIEDGYKSLFELGAIDVLSFLRSGGRIGAA